MGLIKASEAPSKTSVFSMRDVETHAALVITRARSQAEQLIKAAQTEGDKIRSERFEQGYKEGLQAGIAKGMEQGKEAGKIAALASQSAKIEALVSGLATAALQLEASRRKLESETVYDVVRLAVAIARRVTKQLADVSPEVAKANVVEALRMVVNASSVKVALHPTQLSILEEDLPRIRSMFPKLDQVELVPDPSLSPGGCRLLVGSGIVDADIDTQLERIVAELLPPDTQSPT